MTLNTLNKNSREHWGTLDIQISQIVTYAVVEKGMENKGVSFVMMQALELLQLAKRHVSRRSDENQ